MSEVVIDEKAGLREELDVKVAPRSREDDDPNPFAPIPLSHVFALADSLMDKYPWDGPVVRGGEVLGPGSVVQTFVWERAGRPLDTPPDADSAENGAEADEGNEGNGGDKGDKGDAGDEGHSDGARTPRAPQPFSHADAEACIDVEVIVPGGDELDDEEDAAPATLPSKLVPRHFLARVLARSPLGALRRSSFGTALALGILVVGIGALILGWKGGRNWALWWGHVAHGWVRRGRGHVGQLGPNRWLRALV